MVRLKISPRSAGLEAGGFQGRTETPPLPVYRLLSRRLPERTKLSQPAYMFAQLAIKVCQPAIVPPEHDPSGTRYRHRISRNLQIRQ